MLQSPKARWTTPLTVVLCVCAAALIWRQGPILIDAATRPSHGFAAYYTAAALVDEGVDGARLYDDAWFREQVHRRTGGSQDIYNLNTPAAAILARPVAALPYPQARLRWSGAAHVAILWAVALLWRVQRLPLPWLGVLAVGTVSMYPWLQQAWFAQAYGFVLLAVTVAWWGLRTGRAAPGLALGALAVLKLAVAPVWIAPVLWRRWRFTAAAGVGAAAVGLASLPLVGVGAWTTWFHQLTAFGARPELASPGFQSLPSLVRQAFLRHPTWAPDPALEAAWLVPPLTALLCGGVVGLSAWVHRRGDDVDGGVATLVLAGLLVSPVTQEHHLLLALLPIAVVLPRLWARRAWGPLTLAAAAVGLLGAELDYQGAGAPWAAAGILRYPKVLALAVLWAISLGRTPQGSADDDAAPRPVDERG